MGDLFTAAGLRMNVSLCPSSWRFEVALPSGTLIGQLIRVDMARVN
jgi:hypothetical protein